MIRENYKVFVLWLVATIIYEIQIFLWLQPTHPVCGGCEIQGITFPSILYWFFPLIFLVAVFYYLNRNNEKMAFQSAVAFASAPVLTAILFLGFMQFVRWYITL